MKTIRLGVIGYGSRGRSITRKVLFSMPDVEVVAVCDEYADRTERYAEVAGEKAREMQAEMSELLDTYLR